MKRSGIALALLIASACSREPDRAATATIAPAAPRPAVTVTSTADDQRIIATSGSPRPASAAAPGTQYVTLAEGGRIEMNPLVPRGHTAFQIDNDTTAAHQLLVRGSGGSGGNAAAEVPARGTAVVQLLLTGGSYELVCTTPGHSERTGFATYAAGR